MRTPCLLVFGMVMAPCGWVLDLTSTVAPDWREIRNIPGESVDMYLQQGIWDICQAFDSTRKVTCNQVNVDYFNNQIIHVAQGLMVASLVVTLIGLAIATFGVRCWRDRPNWIIAGIGGIFIFLSGVMTLIPIAWYTYALQTIKAESTNIRVGYCIVLGYIGGIMEVLGGAAMIIGMFSCCGGCVRGEKRPQTGRRFSHNRPPAARRIDVPSISRSRSSASSVPYSKDSLDDFPRAKSSSRDAKPCDADL